jgi:hypothetical protein
MTTDTISPLRQRMLEDMNARKLCAGTQRGHWSTSPGGTPGAQAARLPVR